MNENKSPEPPPITETELHAIEPAIEEPKKEKPKEWRGKRMVASKSNILGVLIANKDKWLTTRQISKLCGVNWYVVKSYLFEIYYEDKKIERVDKGRFTFWKWIDA